jgi:hypothetical protein
MTGRLQIVHSLARLQCTKCGAEANASCNCGEPYVPAAIRVKEYDNANPGRSTRAAAADLGISKSEVGRARQSVVPDGTPETDQASSGGKVTGLDGKTYKAKSAPRESVPKAIAAPPITESDDEPAKRARDDSGVFDFEKLKKQVAELVPHIERLTPAQAREIESLLTRMSDTACVIINNDNEQKRLTKEAKNPQKALDHNREVERGYEMDDDRAEAKKEARENGEIWSKVKDDWEAEWLADNWGNEREQRFLDGFKAVWKREHGQEFPGSDFAPKAGGAA